MNILMILDGEFPPDQRVEKEAKSLIESGHHVHIACYTKKHKDGYEIYRNIVIHRRSISEFLHKTSVSILKFPFYFSFWRKFVDKIFSDHTFDAVHIHDLPLAKLGMEFGRKYGIHFILDMHENWPALMKIARHTNTMLGKMLSSNRQWERYETSMVSEAEAIIAVVGEMKDRLLLKGADPDKIYIVSNTIDVKGLKTTQEPVHKKNGKSLILIYVGGITYHRGLQIVINGLEKFVRQYGEIYFWVVGDGSYLNELKATVARRNLQDYVKFFGRRSYEETLEIIRQSDITVIPHIKTEQTDNSSPNKLFEYMYMKKPIIASNCDSVERIVLESKCGISYQHDSPDDLANKINYLMENKDQLINFGNNGRLAVEQKYNWEISARELLTLYDEVADH
jgi:glycosyltransferase involved in cell wall biosynthesis